MDKEYKISGFILFFIIFSSMVVISALAANLISANKTIADFASHVTESDSALSKKDSVIKEKESEIDKCKTEIESLALSYDFLEDEYKKISDMLQSKELLLERSELLERDPGNDFLEADIFKKVVYLTFDDGPSARTISILDTLERYGVKATFFVNYNRYAEEKGIYEMIVDKGHSIGNHTYDHPYPADDWDAFLTSLFKMEDFIFDQTDVRTRVIRFPGGSKDSWKNSDEYVQHIKELSDMGYIYFDWNVNSHDADANMGYIQEDKILELVKIESSGKDKIVLLMHDRSSKYSTMQALDDIIEYYMERDYVFLPITPYSFSARHFKLAEALPVDTDDN